MDKHTFRNNIFKEIDKSKYKLEKVNGRADVTIGKPEKFKRKCGPHARAEMWDGRCWLEVEARGVTPTNQKERLSPEGVLEFECEAKRTKGKPRGEVHRIKHGSLKWEVIYQTLSDLPENYIVFDLSSPEGLTFHYQPELTPEEIAEGCERPDDVIGSYVMYWNKSGRILRHGVEVLNYATGKFGHLYRPKWVAADGDWIWGSQQVVGTELIINIPTTWLQGAKFPIVLDPTFGYDDIGSSSVLTIYNSLHAYGIYTPITNGNVISVSVYSASTGAGNWTHGIYADSSGPTSLLTDTVGAAVPTTNWGNLNLNSSLSVTTGTNYWVGTNRSNTISLAYDAVTFNRYSARSSYTNGVLPNPYPASRILTTNRKYSGYVTYEEVSDVVQNPVIFFRKNPIYRR